MGHVDDTHDAEGDRQTNPRQHQHRSQTDAEIEGLDTRVELLGVLQTLERLPSLVADLGIAVGLRQGFETLQHQRMAQGREFSDCC